MIDSQRVLYSPGNNDECMTPSYGVEPILKYIPKDAVVWCPFDTPHSEFVKVIRKNRTRVVVSHLDDGIDFLSASLPIGVTHIISNPPFTNKRKIFERALSFGKPFALLMNIVWLNDVASKKVFLDAKRQLQLLLLDKRVRYTNPDGRPNNKITFNSSYFCCDFLPRDIEIAELDYGKTNRSNRLGMASK